MNHQMLFRCAAMTLLTLCAHAVFSPTDIDGIELWLKADEGVLDENDETPADGGNIAEWRDLSGHAHHLTQSADNNRPRYAASGLNGLPGVVGGGTVAPRWMTFASPISLRTMFMVGRPTLDGSVNMILARVQGSSTVDIFVSSRTSGDHLSYDGGDTSIKGRYAINGGTLSGYANGHSPTIPTPLLFYMDYESAAQTFTTFMRRPNENFYYSGDISEVIAFNRLLTTGEMNKVGRYLQEKYAITGGYPPIEGAFAITGAADQIADTHARMSAEVAGVTSSPVVLRAYYGQTDAADLASGWWTNEVVSVAAENGIYTHTTTVPLDVGKTYYYRFSVQPSGGSELFAMTSGSFTTRPLVTTQPADRIGDTSARLSTVVDGVWEENPLELWVHYGETNGADQRANWTHHQLVTAEVVTPGTYRVITGNPLVLGRTYWFRFSYVRGGVETFAINSLSFTTQSPDLPARFKYVGDQSVMALWIDETKWENLDKGARLVPGAVAGDDVDIAVVNKNFNLTLLMTNSVTMKNLILGHPASDGREDYWSGGRLNLYNASTEPATLIFDSTVPGTAATFTPRGASQVFVGHDSMQDNLTVLLRSSLLLKKTTTYNFAYHFNSPIVGGTHEAPVPIEMNYASDAWGNLTVFFAVTNNFIGDIILDKSQREMILYAGRYYGTNIPAKDGMFGDPANRIILRRSSQVILNGLAGESFTFNRTLMGYGRIDRVQQNSERINVGALPMVLGERALIAPGEGSAMNTLTLLSSTLDMHPDATLRIKVSPTASDKIVFDCRSAVNLAGRLEIVEQGNMPVGTTWAAVMTAPEQVSELNLKFAYRTPLYVPTVTHNDNGTWTVSLTRINQTTLLILR